MQVVFPPRGLEPGQPFLSRGDLAHVVSHGRRWLPQSPIGRRSPETARPPSLKTYASQSSPHRESLAAVRKELDK